MTRASTHFWVSSRRVWPAGIPRALATLALALSVATCRDAVGPRGTVLGRVAVAPVLPSGGALAVFGLAIDRVRIVVVRTPPAADTVADTTAALPPDATFLDLDLHVALLSSPESLDVTIEALSGTTRLFTGTSRVEVRSGGGTPTPTDIPVDTYIGPGAGVDSIAITPRSPFIYLNDSLRFQVQAFTGGVAEPLFYVAWSSGDSTVAPINSFGVLRAPAARGSVRVRARTPSGAGDSVTAVFTPPAAQLVLIAGAGQTDTVGQQLPIPLEVEARAADGLGVGGVTVRFRSLGGTGGVTDSVVVTDAAGRARTTATLGGGIGPQSYEANAVGLAGSAVTFGAVALAGPPATLLITAGDAQLATVATSVGTRPSVQLRDAGGNPVAGVGVTFAVAAGSGSVTGGSQTTDATGTATIGAWTLGSAAGTNTLTASAPGLTRTFTATGIAGAATQLVRTAGDLQSALVGAAVATAPAVQAQDQYGNPVAGASITFAVSGGGGNVTGPAQLTNGAGVATVGSWTLGTTVGTDTLTATLSGLTPVTFTATALAGAASRIQVLVGGGETAIVNTAVTTAPAVLVTDQFGNPVAGTTVTFTVASGGGSLGAPGAVTTDGAGIATSPAWTIGTAVGANTLTATATALTGSPVTFSATGTAAAASLMVAFAGAGQAALPGTAVSINPAVRVADQFGNPISAVAVTFAVATGGGSLGGPGGAVTDSGGVATSIAWTLGTAVGTNTLQATATGLPTVTFTAEGIASTASSIALAAGDLQTGTVATTLGAYSVIVLDVAGAPVAGVPVSWAVPPSSGTIAPAQPTTDAAGIATATRTLGTVAGTQTATASVGGLAGSPVTFSATALADVPTQLVKQSVDLPSATVGTSVVAPVVKVADRFGNGVAGAIVSFVVTAGGGIVGAAADTTDILGLATAGSWTLGSLTGTNTITATSGALPSVVFTVTGVAGAPAQLAFLTLPARSLAGDTIAPLVQVAIQDQFGNTAFPAKDVVTLGLGPGGNPLAKPLGTLSVPAFNGVATFADVGVDSAGIGYTLLATVVSLTGAESKPFDVGGVIAAFASDRLQPVDAAFNPTNGLVYVPGVNNTLGVLDPNKEPISQLPILQSQPFGVAVNAQSNRVYVTTFAVLAGAVVVIDAATNAPILTIPLTGEGRGIAVDEAADRIYVAVAGDPQKLTLPSLAIIDGKDPRVIAIIPFKEGGQAAGVAFNPKDGLVYVAIPDLGIGVFDPDPATLAHVTTLPIVGAKGAPGTYGVAVDVGSNRIYATNRTEGTVSIIDAAALKEVQRLSVGLLPEGLGVDASRGVVYVGNSGESTVSFIDAGKLSVIATLIVGPTPKAVAVNPGTGQFFVPTLGDDRVRVVQP